ncbi:MAG: hypothetical protein ACLP0J_04835 [Solirubrobacteraceae bacterium]
MSVTVQAETDVVEIGPAIYAVGTAAMGDVVQKRGRTTGLTQNGTVFAVDVTYTATGWQNQKGAARLEGRYASRGMTLLA